MALPWGAIASVGGSVISGLFDKAGSSAQNQAQAAAAQKQMDFQERMSNTSYQRTMADMKKAGLNPILAYKTGGASSPGGAQPNVVNEMTGMSNSAKAATAAVAQLDNVRADTKLKTSQQQTTDTDGAKNVQQWNLLQQEIKRARDLAHSAKAKADVDVMTSKLMTDWLKTPAGKAFWKANIIGKSINPFSGPLNAIK